MIQSLWFVNGNVHLPMAWHHSRNADCDAAQVSSLWLWHSLCQTSHMPGHATYHSVFYAQSSINALSERLTA